VKFQDGDRLGEAKYNGTFAYIDPSGKVIFKYKT
jgi:hypothetical protein